MYPAPFEYHRALDRARAVALLGRYGAEAKLLAGGHSLIRSSSCASPARHLIDVRRIPGLSGVREDGGMLVVGAATPHAMLERSPLVRERLPMLAEAAAQIGDPQVRNMGTIGGSLVHADPSADLPAVMLALGATLVALGPKGPRTLPIDSFFFKLFTTMLGPDELLTEIVIPLPGPGTGGAYEKFPHPASRYAIVGVAAQLTLQGGKISAARIGITGVAAKAYRAAAAEAALVGQAPDTAAFSAAAARATEGVAVRSDPQTGDAYWRSLATTFTRRALQRAAKRAA
jgi:carbon-monoxide dehydrogenase medium subunit